MIDIHSHILPGVDDGARDMNSAIEMARIGRALGFKAIIATPHYIEGAGYKDSRYNEEVLERLNTRLEKNKIDIKIYLGNELYVTPNAIELLEQEKFTTLNGSKYILMELPRLDMPIYIESLIYNLRIKGYVPIIAHPERNAKIMEDPNILYSFIEKGALAQLNLPSLLGLYGETVRKCAEILLRHNMIHFVGTDGHLPDKRLSTLDIALKVIHDIVGVEYKDEIISFNPERLLENQEIIIRSPMRYIPDKGLKKIFKRLFN